MAVERFNWRTERQMDVTINYNVIETSFGDGYKQVSADGINNKTEQYGVRINAKTKIAKEILAFFDRHKGVKSFLWEPPLGQLGLYTCLDPKPQAQGGDLWLITGTFIRSYASLEV